MHLQVNFTSASMYHCMRNNDKLYGVIDYVQQMWFRTVNIVVYFERGYAQQCRHIIVNTFA